MGVSIAADGSLTITDEATPREDLQALADRVEAAGGLLKVTSSQRSQLTGNQTRVGWLIVETDTGRIYERTTQAPQGRLVHAPDTGWTDAPPLTTGWTPSGPEERIQFRVLNGFLLFRGRLNATSVAVGQMFATALPEGARPGADLPYVALETSPAHGVITISALAIGHLVATKGGTGVFELSLATLPPIPVT